MARKLKFTNTCGGSRDQTAVIGHAPESRDWTPDKPAYAPTIGEGVRIEAFVTVDAGESWSTYVGDHTWLMKACHVGHDAHIGHDCELAPGARIGGYAKLEGSNKVGMNATVKPHVHVGYGARIGMGAVVVKNVAPYTTVVGNPAKPIRKPRPCAICRELGSSCHCPDD